jgi:copper chaperone
MEEKTTHIPSISCGHCVMAIKHEIGEQAGVKSVDGDEQTKMVTFRWDEPASWNVIADKLKEIGYPSEE